MTDVIVLVGNTRLDEDKITFVEVLSSFSESFSDVLVFLGVLSNEEHGVAATGLIEETVREVFVHNGVVRYRVVSHPLCHLVSIRFLFPLLSPGTMVLQDSYATGLSSISVGTLISRSHVFKLVVVDPRCSGKCSKHGGIEVLSKVN